jgi:DNA (cytosine-5)-methyltransferase 1
VVEWRVVNAAEHGWAQQRKRVFILAYHQSTSLGQATLGCDAADCLQTSGVMAQAFALQPLAKVAMKSFALSGDPVLAQAELQARTDKKSPFLRGGLYANGVVSTAKVKPAIGVCEAAKAVGVHTLGDVIAKTSALGTTAAESFFIVAAQEARWREVKGAHSNLRTTADGFQWTYSEGALSFPDRLDRASRTVITSEGGSCASRTKHVVQDASGRLRRLLPDELDELSGFPRGWTACPGVSDSKRARLVGNALVTGVVRQIGEVLAKHV